MRTATRPPATAAEKPALSGRDRVQSLERGLAVIRCFDGAPELTLSQVAARTGITRAAARRFLLTLEGLGYVGRTAHGFCLLPRTLELGYSFLSSFSLPQLAQPHVQRLAHGLDEPCGVTVLDEDHIVYVLRIAANRLVGARLSTGSRIPAWCTAGGRVLLGSLDERALEAYLRGLKTEKRTPKTLTDKALLRAEIRRVAKQGWCITDQQIDHGVRALAVPLRNAAGRTVAALNVSCYSGRVSLQDLARSFLPQLQATAKAIESDLRANVDAPGLYGAAR